MRWARGSSRRLPADAPPMHRLRALNRYFFNELGFGGNVNNYYDRRNSYLNDVLATRRGIPITLALLYMPRLAGQLGLKSPVACRSPGHFLVKLRLPQGEVVDRSLQWAQRCRATSSTSVWRPTAASHGLEGDDDVPLGLFLQAADPRDVIGAPAAQPQGDPPQRRRLAAPAGGACTGWWCCCLLYPRKNCATAA
jgi:regulator of sirC expression with transglutaminase-like and TPR domain